MITDKQIAAISKLSFEDKCTVVREIFEDLGCVTVDEYIKVMAIGKNKRRKVYHDIEAGRIVCLPIFEKKWPCINETLKQLKKDVC